MKALKRWCRSATFDHSSPFSTSTQKLMKLLEWPCRSAYSDHWSLLVCSVSRSCSFLNPNLFVCSMTSCGCERTECRRPSPPIESARFRDVIIFVKYCSFSPFHFCVHQWTNSRYFILSVIFVIFHILVCDGLTHFRDLCHFSCDGWDRWSPPTASGRALGPQMHAYPSHILPEIGNPPYLIV
jgi:hypothetical protein